MRGWSYYRLWSDMGGKLWAAGWLRQEARVGSVHLFARTCVAMQGRVTPLHLAVCNGHKAVVTYLVAQGADLGATTNVRNAEAVQRMNRFETT